MKQKLLLCLFFAMPTFACFAQLTDERSVWNNSDLKGKVKSLTETTYIIVNGDPKLKITDQKITIQDETIKNYDRNGLITDQSLISYIGGESKRWVFTYDSQNRMIEEAVYNDKGLDETVVYTYSGNNLTQKVWYKGATKNLEKTWYYQYDGNGKLLSEYWADANGQISWKSVYKYDVQGNMTEKSWIVDDRTTSKWTCKYDDNGRAIENAEYANGILKEMTYNSYDRKGLLQGVKVFKSDDVPDYRKEFSYNGKGNLRMEWWYDAGGKLIQRRNFDYDKIQNMIASFTWGGDNKLLDKTYRTYDGTGNYYQQIDYEGQIPVFTIKRTISYY
ncbi:MAG: hypothetical protein FWF54_09480 [Candidatus Azobacteroides sp.]|nr:hypothetical protein [Candidatus Azobacteroides sp.]